MYSKPRKVRKGPLDKVRRARNVGEAKLGPSAPRISTCELIERPPVSPGAAAISDEVNVSGSQTEVVPVATDTHEEEDQGVTSPENAEEDEVDTIAYIHFRNDWDRTFSHPALRFRTNHHFVSLHLLLPLISILCESIGLFCQSFAPETPLRESRSMVGR